MLVLALTPPVSFHVISRTNYVLEAHVIADIKEMIKTHFGESSLDTRIEWVKDCCSKRDLLSVFELDSKNSAKDVDLAILKALLKGKQDALCKLEDIFLSKSLLFYIRM